MQYDNIIFDLDSTLVSIEGIDELGKMVGKAKEIQRLTTLAMQGDVSLESVFEQRLRMIQPTLRHMRELSHRYAESITPGAQEVIAQLHTQGKKVFIITGGYKNALHVVIKKLGIPLHRVFANELYFSLHGSYKGFNTHIPLWKNHGKTEVALRILKKFPGKTLVVGDGMSDMEVGVAVGTFVYFGGHVWRESIARHSHYVFKKKNMVTFLDLFKKIV